MYCYRVDPAVGDLLQVAHLSHRAASVVAQRGVEGVLLATCHRVELYTLKPPRTDDLRAVLGESVQVLTGTPAVFAHLLALMTGVQSQIWGERYIAGQVAEAFAPLAPAHPLRSVMERARGEAQRVRAAHHFYAAYDYDHILLNQVLPHADDPLFIFGSGMLVKHVLEKLPPALAAKTTVFSRSPKEIRKKMRRQLPDNPLTFLAPTVLDGLSVLAPFSVFIATSDLDAAYQGRMAGLLRQPSCRRVVDFSAIPLFGDVVGADCAYMTLYNALFAREVDKNNQPLAIVRDKVLADIAARAAAMAQAPVDYRQATG